MRRPSNLGGLFSLYGDRWGKSGDTGASGPSWMLRCHFGYHPQDDGARSVFSQTRGDDGAPGTTYDNIVRFVTHEPSVSGVDDAQSWNICRGTQDGSWAAQMFARGRGCQARTPRIQSKNHT
jgi:hypothetical protein